MNAQDLKYLIDIRKYLHQHPDISGNEIFTAQVILKEIQQCKPVEIIENLGGNGIAAVFGDVQAEKTILFRAELDALPIQEINTFPHRSKNDGISHKCGHDGHSTILLGLAKELREYPLDNKKVVLLFQPSEEDGIGARAVLEDKKFRKIHPDFVFSLHNVPGYKLGDILIREYAFTPAVTSIKIVLNGKTSHAAEPEFGVNPDMAIQQLIKAIRALEHSDQSSEDFCVVTTIYGHIGSKDYGISAGKGELHFTLRCWTSEKIDEVKEKVETIIKTVCRAERLDYHYEWFYDFFPNTNDPQAVKHILKAAEENNYRVIYKEFPFKWGEDFGLFTQKYKGAMFAIGAGTDSPALHNPDYDFPDELLPRGIQMFFSIIQSFDA